MNTDFDALASMLAAKKLYPEGTLVLTDKQETKVKQFLNIYRDTFHFVRDSDIDWKTVSKLILVDVASLQRIGNFTNQLQLDDIEIIVYDHHPPHKNNVKYDDGIVEPVGATVTLLVEEIRRKSLPISEIEATIFGLGIYTDTGNFTYNTTTKRDLQVASYLMECGMNLEMIQRFSEQSLLPEQQELLDDLFINAETIELDGLTIVITTYEQEHFQGGLALLTQKLLEMKGADATISVVKMKHHVYIVGRATAERINLQPLLKKFGGGGHNHAGSATVKRGDFKVITSDVKANLHLMLQPAITARQIMSYPVKTLSPKTTIEKAGQLMYRYGHSGYPIVDDEDLIGIITRRDLDKANHHGLGHAPVKAYMSTKIVSITPETTLEEIQKIIINYNIGRLPVVEEGKLIGIVTRTNIIEEINKQTLRNESSYHSISELKNNVTEEMKEHLPEQIMLILNEISKIATVTELPVYLIGGIVRDILLKLPNDDVDIVVEGDGIAFATKLCEQYGGEITKHDNFGTATWEHPTHLKIDIASSRLEYYERPASLPDVEGSTLQEDLYRRDFTINAMAICLNEEKFGELVDPFSGQYDLYKRTIKVLHNLSFVEDPTRILRAVRFESRFQFNMDEQTEKLALHSIEQMKDVSETRIIDEIKRLFQEENPMHVTNRLYSLNFWQQYINDNSSSKNAIIVTQKLYELLNWAKTNILNKQLNEWFIYFLVPFFVAEKYEQAKPFALKKAERKILYESMQLINEPITPIKQLGQLQLKLKAISDETILFTVALQHILDEKLVKQYLIKRQSIPTFITGDELKQYGLKPGPMYKEILLQLEVAILNDDVQSKSDAQKWLENYLSSLE